MTVHQLPFRSKRKRERKEPEQWVCRRCEADLGVATSEVVPVIQSPRTNGKTLQDGTKAGICLHCLRRGIITEAP